MADHIYRDDALSRRRDDLRRLAAGEKTRLAAPPSHARLRRAVFRELQRPNT